MSKLDDLISSARERLQKPKMQDVDVLLGEELVTLRIARLSGAEFVAISATHPPRTGSKVDSAVGFDVHAVGEAVARKYGKLIIDGEEVEPSRKQWDGIFDALSAPDIEAIGTVVWALNVYSVNTEKQSLKKASLSGEESSN